MIISQGTRVKEGVQDRWQNRKGEHEELEGTWIAYRPDTEGLETNGGPPLGRSSHHFL